MYLSLCSREGNNKFKILKLKLKLEWRHTYNKVVPSKYIYLRKTYIELLVSKSRL